MEYFDEIIGFLIVLFVFLFPLLRKLLLGKKAPPPPPPQPEEESVEYEEMVIEREVEPEPVQSSGTEGLVKRDFAFHSDMEERHYESRITTRGLDLKAAPEVSRRLVSDSFILGKVAGGQQRGATPLEKLEKIKDPYQKMVIYSEIFGSPKGLE